MEDGKYELSCFSCNLHLFLKTRFFLFQSKHDCTQRKMEQMSTTGSIGEFRAPPGRRTRRSRGERIFVWEISKFLQQMEINIPLFLNNEKKCPLDKIPKGGITRHAQKQQAQPALIVKAHVPNLRNAYIPVYFARVQHNLS